MKRDPTQEPIAASYSAPGVLAEGAHKTGRPKPEFEFRKISETQFQTDSCRSNHRPDWSDPEINPKRGP